MLVGSSNTPSLTLSWTTRSCGVAAELRDPARPAMDHQLQHPQPHQGKSTGPEPDLCHWNINDRHFTKSLRMILEEEYFVLRHLQILLNQAFTSISSLDEFFVTLSPKANEHNDEKFDDESFVALTKQARSVPPWLIIEVFGYDTHYCTEAGPDRTGCRSVRS